VEHLKPVKVHSHPRSGTHLLAACLKLNFYPDVNLGRDVAGIGHWSQRVKVGGFAWIKLLGGHNFWNGQTRGVYVYRDGRDVAASLFRSKRFLNRKWAGMTFAEFLREPLDWRGSPAQRAEPGPTIAEHWRAHLESWLPRPGVVGVRYEDLCTLPNMTLEGVREALGLEHQGKYTVPQELVGVLPNEGRIGAWRDYFDADDVAFFFERVPGNFWGLWDGG